MKGLFRSGRPGRKERMSKRQFDISIDHAMMKGAKAAFDKCMQIAVTRAIATGSDEGSATLRISFEIVNALDEQTGEEKRIPAFKFKAGYSVPMKDSVDATITEDGRLVSTKDGWMLVNGQISMDELMTEE